MKSLLFVALVGVFGVVNAGPSCRREITSYTMNNLVCVENGLKVQRFASKLAKDELTYEEFANEIADACSKANSASCYIDISTPIDGSCNEAESVQHFRNALKTVLIFNENLCQNNGQKYLDFVKDGGAECYLMDEKAKCYKEATDLTQIGDLTFTDENVCGVVNADWGCLHYYKTCENQNVYVYYQQILRSLREKFSC